MKKNKILLLACTSLMIFTGCTDRQMTGTMVGTSLGSIFGSSIGGLLNGPRGSDAGTAIGMIVGGVIGNAAVSAGAKKEQTQDNGDYSQQDEGNVENQAPAQYSSSNLDGLNVENIRFVDENHNQCIDAGENAKIVFEIHNKGNAMLYNVTPVLTVDIPRKIEISPTAIVGNIEPGKGVVYTAALQASQRLKDGHATFTLAFQDGNRTLVYKTFQLATFAKR